MAAASSCMWYWRRRPEAGVVALLVRWWLGAGRDQVGRLTGAGGQGIVEYGLILGLSALFAVATLVFFGSTVADVVRWIGQTVDATTGG